MGFYYSLYEWFNPLYHSDVKRYVDEHMLPQMKDLVTQYHPDIFWTDGEWDHTSEVWKSPEFLAWLYNESPVKESVVVNDRWGKETRGKHGGIYTTEYDQVPDQRARGAGRNLNLAAVAQLEDLEGVDGGLVQGAVAGHSGHAQQVDLGACQS